MNTAQAHRIWVVEPNDDLRDLLAEVVDGEAEVMAETEFHRRIGEGDLPGALVIDGTTVLNLDGQRPAIDGIARIVVITGRLPGDLPADLLERPGVQMLTKPFGLDDFERAVGWVARSKPLVRDAE